jgi:hypothetical protein
LPNLIEVYPNPANTNLQVDGVAVGGQITLINTLGDIIFTTPALAETTSINTAALSSGVYVLMIAENGNITTHKILIAH